MTTFYYFGHHKCASQYIRAILRPVAPWVPTPFRPRRLYRWLRRTLFSRRPAETERAPFCFKDPRFSYTLPAWRPYLQETVFICIFRHPAATAASMLKEARSQPRLRDFHVSLGDCFEIWRWMYTHILKIHSQQGEWLFIHYNQVLTEAGLDRLEAFVDDPLDRSFRERSLRHSRPETPTPEHISPIYTRLCLRAGYTGGL